MERKPGRVLALSAAAVLLVAVSLIGCGESTESGADAAVAREAGGADAGSGAEAGSVAATFGSGSNFSSVQGYFNYVNDKRKSYASHTRWSGFPFSGGKYHSNVTWPYTMQWSDAAAAAAQVEADAVAGGASPGGKQTLANPGQLPIYVDGLNTASYMVGGKERPGSFITSTCTLCNSNTFMRMAVFYHDPGGAGPVLTRIGIGAADLGNGETWWVIRFAP